MWAVGLILGMLFLGSDPVGSPSPTANIEPPARTSCNAPCGIPFNANKDSIAPAGMTEGEFLGGCLFTWSYDDPDKGAFSTGKLARSSGIPDDKNTTKGWLGGHVWEDPGTYDVELRITCAGELSTDTVQITVNDPDVTFSATTTCVADDVLPVAGSGGCPSGAAVLLSSDFDAAVSTTCNADTAKHRCLFKRGGRYVSDTVVDFSVANQARQIGAYGFGAEPIIDASALSGSVLVFDDTLDDDGLEIFGLRIQGNVESEDQKCLFVNEGDGPQHVTIHRSIVEYCDSALYGRHTNAILPLVDNVLRYWVVSESDFRYCSGNGGVCEYLTIADSAFLGHRVRDMLLRPDDGDSGEHLRRHKFRKRVLDQAVDVGWFDWRGELVEGREVVGCCFSNISDGEEGAVPGEACEGNLGGTIFTTRASFATQPGVGAEGYSTHNVYSDIQTMKCRDTAQDFQIGNTGKSDVYTEERHEYVLIEDMLQGAGPGVQNTDSSQFMKVESADQVFIRNLTQDASNTLGSQRGIIWNINCDQQSDTGYVPPGTGFVEGWTFYQNSDIAETRQGIQHTWANGPCTPEWDIQVDGGLAFEPDGSVDLINPASFQSVTCCGGACDGTCNPEATSDPFPNYDPSFVTVAGFEVTGAGDQADALACFEALSRDGRGCIRETSGSCDAGSTDHDATCVEGLTLYSCGTGNWSSSGTWDLSADCLSAGDGVPTRDDEVFIQTGTTVTMDLATGNFAARLTCDGTLSASSPLKRIEVQGDIDILGCSGLGDDLELAFAGPGFLRSDYDGIGATIGSLDIGRHHVKLRPGAIVSPSNELNTEAIKSDGGMLGVDCSEVTTGTCPSNSVAVEFQLDASGVDACSNGEDEGSVVGLLKLDGVAIQHESTCPTAGNSYIRVPQTEGERIPAIDATGNVNGDGDQYVLIPVGDETVETELLTVQKGGTLDLAGQDIDSNGVTAAGGVRIGDANIGATGDDVGLILSGALVTTTFVRFDPDEGDGQTASLTFNGATAGLVATTGMPSVAGQVDLFIDPAGGSDAANDCQTGVAPCATLAHAIDEANILGSPTIVRFRIDKGQIADETGSTFAPIAVEAYLGHYFGPSPNTDNPIIRVDCGDVLSATDDFDLHESTWDCL